ncbi:MAG: hypothetical protein HGA45_10310 [Chloroflexales bacterium]|nr:hypothetical protein [Chloroflexales bacterium]
MSIIVHLILAALIAAGAVPPMASSASSASAPLTMLQPPTPQPAGATDRPRGNIGIALALLCVAVLSSAALFSSIAVKRRIDSISPDK